MIQKRHTQAKQLLDMSTQLQHRVANGEYDGTSPFLAAVFTPPRVSAGAKRNDLMRARATLAAMAWLMTFGSMMSGIWSTDMRDSEVNAFAAVKSW